MRTAVAHSSIHKRNPLVGPRTASFWQEVGSPDLGGGDTHLIHEGFQRLAAMNGQLGKCFETFGMLLLHSFTKNVGGAKSLEFRQPLNTAI